MNIADMREKCKGFLARIPRDVLSIGVLVIVASLCFGLGYLAGLDAGSPTQTGQGNDLVIETTPPAAAAAAGYVVASKSGTKYYPQDCAGANRITEANKVWFASAAIAETAGYAPAANCK
jgi:hypothetical protein